MEKQVLQIFGGLCRTLFEIPSGIMCNNKPEVGGLWTSTLLENDESQWTQFARSEGIYSGSEIQSLNVFEITVDPEANVLTIDSKEDYIKVLSKYGQPIKGNHLLEMTCSLHNHSCVLDYEKLTREFDALHLTQKGIRENFYEFYGWDVESTVWFTLDKFKVTRIIKRGEMVEQL